MKYTVALALALSLITSTAEAGLQPQTFQLARNFDGTYNGLYPTGAKPPTIEACTWDISNALEILGFNDMRVGTPFETSLRPYAFGTESSTAPIVIVPVSGDDPATEGMSITDDCATDACLEHSAAQTGAGQVRFELQCSSGNVLSAIKPWSVTNPASVPAQVTGLNCTTISTTEIDCTCDAVPGADTYNAIRVGAATVTGLTSCAYNFTGLTADTPYTLSFSATNTTGTGTASATQVISTAADPTGDFNPPYPRLASRPHGAFDAGNSQATLLAEAAIVAEFHFVVMSGVRTSTWGTNTNLQTLPALIKGFNPDVKIVKYHNAQQQNIDSANEQWIMDKLSNSTGGGGNDDWWLTSTAHTNAHDVGTVGTTSTTNHYFGGAGQSKSFQLRINPTLKTSVDANGFRWPQWFARFWWYQDGDNEVGVTDDWQDPVASRRGKGLRGGQWDGVFSDDQYLYKNHGDYANIDYDSNGVAEDLTSDTVKMWVGEGHQALRDTWKGLAGNDWIFMGNTLHMMAPTETIPTAFEGTYDGVFIQDITKLYETRTGDGWQKMMDAYRRGFLLSSGPEIVFFHSNIQAWEDKANGAGMPDPPGNLSNARWNRYGLASALMDNGYYGLMITDGPAELDQFDEFYGGTTWSVANMGWLGYPTQPPQTTPYSQGVYVRLFDNGYAAVNPRGNGTRTITLPSAGTGCHWDNLTGTQDAVWNDGAHNVTQLTNMPQREGRLGKRHCP